MWKASSLQSSVHVVSKLGAGLSASMKRPRKAASIASWTPHAPHATRRALASHEARKLGSMAWRRRRNMVAARPRTGASTSARQRYSSASRSRQLTRLLSATRNSMPSARTAPCAAMQPKSAKTGRRSAQRPPSRVAGTTHSRSTYSTSVASRPAQPQTTSMRNQRSWYSWAAVSASQPMAIAVDDVLLYFSAQCAQAGQVDLGRRRGRKSQKRRRRPRAAAA